MANVNFRSQLATIMEVLSNAAVREICRLVDNGYAVLRLELSGTQRENLALKSRLMEVRSRDRLPRRITAQPSRKKAVKHSSRAKRTTRPMLHADLGSHPSGAGEQAILVKEEDLGDGASQLNMVNVSDEDEASTLWQQQCGSSAEDDDSRSPAVTGLEEEKEKDEEEKRPAPPADSSTATLEMWSGGGGGGLDPSPYLPALIVKEEDETQYEAYGECAVTSKATQVSQQHDYEDIKGEPSGLAATPQVDKWFTCHHCGLSYAQQKALIKHLRHTHTPARCKVCNEEFPNNKTLAVHLKISCARKYQTTRKEVKGKSTSYRSTASCPTCSRSILITHLSRHMLTHTGDRPFRCQVCGKSFLYEGSYETHQRSHVQEKYHCSDCGKAFKERSERDFHKCVVFKGEMEFGCTACGESFGRLSLLKRHRLSEHADMNFDPEETLGLAPIGLSISKVVGTSFVAVQEF